MEKKQAILMASIMAVMAIVTFASTISADEQTEMTQIEGTEYTQYTIMKPDPETLHEWMELYNSAPQAYIDPRIKMMIEQSPGAFFSLLDHIEYDPIERNQGSCGNCWVWAGTGVLETALDVQEGIKDRLSVQYFTSCWHGGVANDWACCGGWLEWFADGYQTNVSIPWSNTNAHWQDGTRMCVNETSVTCESISTSCNYPITNCTATSIETHGVVKETAIANIKNVLHQNKTIWFAYFLPTGEDWDNFRDFWRNDPENTIWNPDFSCGHTWVEHEGGGHAVLCVGYNDTDPNNSYWIMLNSWGTTGGRPNGLFYLDMDMDYDCYYTEDGANYYSFYWETLNVTFEITPIEKGLCWLTEHQNPDGSWTGSAGKNVGYTSLATLAFLNAGINESDPTVSKAMNYILSNTHPDGSIYSGWYSNYETSLAILPLVATHNSSYDDEIAAARNFLVGIQNDEGEGLTNLNWTYGGWGYAGNSPGWSDLSNTQWSLMGLDAAGLSKTSNTWSKGELYVTRCQNLQATNPEYDVTNDGGFTYQPPNISCCWGCNGDPKQSYGAITAAGVWSLRLCGVNDQRVQAGLNWLRNNYAPIDTVGNPCHGDTYLYYYLLSFAKALIMTGIPAGSWQETASNDITNYIVSQQYDDGHWTSNEGALFATEQAILALQTRTIPTDIQRLSYLTFILCSNADLHVYDPLGRHVGKNYDTGGIDLEIPNATYTTNAVQNITIPGLETGNYRIVLVGTGTGEYTLNVTGGVGNDTVSEDSYTGNITEGEVHDAEVNVAMITWLTIHVEEPDEIDTMVQAATGTGPVYFILEASEIEDLTALNESDMPEENPTVEFPHGLFGFNITGLTLGQNVTLIITFPSDIPTTAQYWKYNTSSGEWYQIPMGSNDGDNIITIALQDGGIGDDDGVANGVIVDQGGPGVPTGVARVPTLTPIGIIALAGLLAIVAVSRIRKKK